MSNRSAENGAVDVFIAACMDSWRKIAPSYVQSTQQPLVGHLRELHAEGATAWQFHEALEMAFAKPGVKKRDALRYAHGIVRHQLREASPDGA